jgi:hypothetical protein
MARSITKTRSAGTYLGDLIRAEFHRSYNFVSAKVKNTGSSNLLGAVLTGQPMKVVSTVHNFVLTTDEANTTALFAHDKPMPSIAAAATSDDLFLILKRGPAVIDQDALPTADVNGATLVPATIATALAALSPPIIAVSEPAQTKTQSL